MMPPVVLVVRADAIDDAVGVIPDEAEGFAIAVQGVAALEGKLFAGWVFR